MKIGIFDSGLGGLFLMKAVVKKLPQYDYIYLGDTANLTYGDKTQGQIYTFTKRALDYLFAYDCAIVFLFCNTASAMALRRLQSEGYRVLGVIIPTVEVATSVSYADRVKKQKLRIGILATQSTVDSKKYIVEIKKINPNAQVFQQSAPKLVPMIENEMPNLFTYEKILGIYLEPLLINNINTLILGCTHYAILKKQIRALLPAHIQLISQDEIVGPKVSDYLVRHSEIESAMTKNSTQKYLVTKLTPEFERQAKLWFGDGIQLELVAT